ncbi:MAG: DNA polymerase IV [Desulfuromonadales bacterium]
MAEQRAILHLDMDAFYAAVEQRDYPELRGRPVLVGGNRHRGVVSASSYEARRYGVHSAMAMARAVRLCPQAVVRPVRMQRYQQVSQQIFAIFNRYTDAVEPLSIDEAFLDVTGSRQLFGSGRRIAEQIRLDVRQELDLSVSAGIAPNKFLAKLASEAAKPDGLLELTADRINDFLLPLPVARLWGVGKVTAARLERLGLRTVADLRQAGRELLVRRLGNAGDHLFRLAYGKDERRVIAQERAKSVGHEETFDCDVVSVEELRRPLLALAERVAGRLRKSGLVGATLTLKVRYGDFVTVTRSQTLEEGTDHAMTIFRHGEEMLRRTEAGRRPVRLLGLTLGRLGLGGKGQQDLFAEEDRQRLQALDHAIDNVQARFGGKAVCRATLLDDEASIKRGNKR